MLEQVNQQIEVLVAFMRNKILPLSFRWENKRYSVKKVNLVNSEYKGREKIYYFSVNSNNDYFKLAFYSHSQKWVLQEAYFE
ncbi:MAG TPA: hypothetical protein VKP03_01730 [Patescibacteria group bacterium]|nr:hypothetical protein [Patescibacteria group bacterium]